MAVPKDKTQIKKMKNKHEDCKWRKENGAIISICKIYGLCKIDQYCEKYNKKEKEQRELNRYR